MYKGAKHNYQRCWWFYTCSCSWLRREQLLRIQQNLVREKDEVTVCHYGWYDTMRQLWKGYTGHRMWHRKFCHSMVYFAPSSITITCVSCPSSYYALSPAYSSMLRPVRLSSRSLQPAAAFCASASSGKCHDSALLGRSSDRLNCSVAVTCQRDTWRLRGSWISNWQFDSNNAKMKYKIGCIQSDEPLDDISACLSARKLLWI